MSRKKKKPRKARGKRKPSAWERKALKTGIAVLLWLAAAIATQTLEHYLPIVFGW